MKFLIIDGHSIAYRAFYALPLLQNKKGEHTNAIYGFANMLMGILEKTGPDYAAAAFDRAAPTFRHKVYADYKAQREATPEELNEQITKVKELLAAYKIPVYELDGYEADDIIGYLSLKAEEEGMETLLFSGDKDLFQLISPTTRVVMARKGITDLQEYDLSSLESRYNLKPEQMVDFKALTGDPSDNIPGVPGIGEKTALKLLHQYQSLDELLKSTGELKGKLKERLEENKEQARLSRQLVTISRNIEELDFTWEQCHLTEPDYSGLRQIFAEMEFKSLMGKLPVDSTVTGGNSQNSTLSTSAELVEITDVSQIAQIKKDFGGQLELSMLIEPGSDYPRWKHAPQALAFAVNRSKAYYFHSSTFTSGAWENFLRELWSGTEELKIRGHNVKLLINMLVNLGLPEPKPSFDSMLAAYLLEPGRGDLERAGLLQEYLGINCYSVDSSLLAHPNPEELSCGLAREAAHLFELQEVMERQIEDQGLNRLYFDLELPLSLILGQMERQGIRVDEEKLSNLSQEINSIIHKLREEVYSLAGEEFNLNSPQQLSRILFEKLQLPVIKKTKTGYSTDVTVLEELAKDYDIAAKILYHRQLVKLESTYLSGLKPYILQDSGKIFTTFNQTITATGRLSSSEPNLQNIPVRMEEGRRIRQAFVPSSPNYIFLAADYSQIELRVLAHLSQDPTLVEAFQNDEDIHRRTAAEIFEVPTDEVTSSMRKRAKAVNFGIVYGISDYGLSQDLKIPRKEAQKYIDNYFARYQGVKDYMEKIVETAREQGYVSTIFNRRRYLPEINDRNFSRRSFAERTARNTPIQGSAADIIKLAMLRIHHELAAQQVEARLLLQVHDELIWELPPAERLVVTSMVKEEMENAVQLLVPVQVDISYGSNWYEMG